MTLEFGSIEFHHTICMNEKYLTKLVMRAGKSELHWAPFFSEFDRMGSTIAIQVFMIAATEKQITMINRNVTQ